PAVPGFEPPVLAVCVAPFGTEEGRQADVTPQEFALVVGEPTVFRFFASSVRRDDRVGDVVEDAVRSDELEEVAPIETSLQGEPGLLVPVNLQAAVTEVGTLELRCLQKGGAGRWKLELNVRKDQGTDAARVPRRYRSGHVQLRRGVCGTFKRTRRSRRRFLYYTSIATWKCGSRTTASFGDIYKRRARTFLRSDGIALGSRSA